MSHNDPIKAVPRYTKLSLKPETRKKFDRVAKAKRWKLVTVAEVAVDFYIEHGGIDGESVPTANCKQAA